MILRVTLLACLGLIAPGLSRFGPKSCILEGDRVAWPGRGPHIAPAGNRVIRLMVFSRGVWGFDGRNGRAYETPDSVLTMIAELKPNILDRFFNDPIPDLNAALPAARRFLAGAR
ncbi:MAG: hypothetical protein ACP5VE_02565 [Chthonomonadales bacterium]